MDWNAVAGNWKQLKGKLKETWGDLTDDDLDVIAGKRDQLVGKIQAKYGINREEAEKQVDAFTLNCSNERKLDGDGKEEAKLRLDDSERYQS